MACPACGCKVCYQYDDEDFGVGDDRLERCAACGHVFDVEDHADEEDGDEDEPAAHGVLGLPFKATLILDNGTRVAEGVIPGGAAATPATSTMGADQVWGARRLSDPTPAACQCSRGCKVVKDCDGSCAHDVQEVDAPSDGDRLRLVLQVLDKRDDNMPMTRGERDVLNALNARGDWTVSMRLRVIDSAIRTDGVPGTSEASRHD